MKYIDRDGTIRDKKWIEHCREVLIESTLGVLDPSIINNFIDSDIVIDGRNNYEGNQWTPLYSEFAKIVSNIDIMNRYGIIWIKSLCDKQETIFVRFIYDRGCYSIVEMLINDTTFNPYVTYGSVHIYNSCFGIRDTIDSFQEAAKANKKIKLESFNCTFQFLSGSLKDAKALYEKLKHEKVY